MFICIKTFRFPLVLVKYLPEFLQHPSDLSAVGRYGGLADPACLSSWLSDLKSADRDLYSFRSCVCFRWAVFAENKDVICSLVFVWDLPLYR